MAIPPDLKTPFIPSSIAQQDPDLGKNWVSIIPKSTVGHLQKKHNELKYHSFYEAFKSQDKQFNFELHMPSRSLVSHAFKKNVRKITTEYLNKDEKSEILEVDAGPLLTSTKMSYLTSFLPKEFQDRMIQSDKQIPSQKSSLPYISLNLSSALTSKMLKTKQSYPVILSCNILETHSTKDLINITENIHRLLKDNGLFIQISDQAPATLISSVFVHEFLEDENCISFPFFIDKVQPYSLLCVSKELVTSKFDQMNSFQKKFIKTYFDLPKMDKDSMLMNFNNDSSETAIWNEISDWIAKTFGEEKIGFKKINMEQYLNEKIQNSLKMAGFKILKLEEQTTSLQVKNHKDPAYNCVESNWGTIEKSIKKEVPQGFVEQTSIVRVVIAQKISSTSTQKVF